MDNENIVAAENQPQTDAETAEVQTPPTVSTDQPETVSAEAPEAAEAAPAGDVAPAEQPANDAAPTEAKSDGPKGIEDLKPGMRLMGKVKNLVDFGAFVDIGVGRDGLAHISTLKRAGIDKTLAVGDEIEVQVRRADLDNNRISLTIPGAGRSDKTKLEDLQVGSTVTGRVVRLVDFGAFVDVDAQTDGLLHISQLSNGFVSQVGEVLEVGQEIEVRILDVDTERRRISLTMKDENAVPEAAPSRDADAPARPRRERRERGRSRRREPQVMSTEQEPAEPGSTGIFAEAWERALRTKHGK